jgi:inhibitor of KinA sporulation pathway (predicted exonuclease)
MSVYVCVLDFEATCWKQSDVRRKKMTRKQKEAEDKKRSQMEIIEFPSVLVKWNLETGETTIIGEIRQYCKPRDKPILSKFCTELTGITQSTVDDGILFPQALKDHEAWLRSLIPNMDTEEVYLMTVGRWDIATQLPRDLLRWKINSKNINKIYKRYINLKEEFVYFLKTPKDKKFGMVGMLRHLNLKLRGRHHSGIDDCRNTVQILEKLVEKGMKWNDLRVLYA